MKVPVSLFIINTGVTTEWGDMRYHTFNKWQRFSFCPGLLHRHKSFSLPNSGEKSAAWSTSKRSKRDQRSYEIRQVCENGQAPRSIWISGTCEKDSQKMTKRSETYLAWQGVVMRPYAVWRPHEQWIWITACRRCERPCCAHVNSTVGGIWRADNTSRNSAHELQSAIKLSVVWRQRAAHPFTPKFKNGSFCPRSTSRESRNGALLFTTIKQVFMANRC